MKKNALKMIHENFKEVVVWLFTVKDKNLSLLIEILDCTAQELYSILYEDIEPSDDLVSHCYLQIQKMKYEGQFMSKTHIAGIQSIIYSHSLICNSPIWLLVLLFPLNIPIMGYYIYKYYNRCLKNKSNKEVIRKIKKDLKIELEKIMVIS